MTDKKGYYAALNIPPDADEKQIKDAFRRQVKLCHPDKNDTPEARELYLKINEAYQVLINADARAVYDGENNAAGFVPCCRCGKHVRQPRYIYFDEGGATLHGGVYCRHCASKQQFTSAVKVWKKFFAAPVQSWSALKTNTSLRNMPDEKNFDILMQNANAFQSERRSDIARSMAEQAKKFAKEQQQRVKINIFLNALPETPARKEPDNWKIRWTDVVRVYLPLFLCLIVGVVMMTTPYLHELVLSHPLSRSKPVTGFNDLKHAAVIPFGFDLADEDKLYHTTEPHLPAYQAPNEDSGIIAVLPEQTTLRLTGYVPDTDWMQAMTARGLIVFVKAKYLRQGIGAEPLPYESKIVLRRD